jgi:soluble lytic murein transglycosylase-like protein
MKLAPLLALAGGLAWAGVAQADVLEIGANGSVKVLGDQPGAAWSSPGEPVEAADGEVPSAAMTLVDEPLSDSAYAKALDQVSKAYDISPRLLEALVWQESRWNQGAVSRTGAIGLAQLMPGTARELGVNPHDPLQNLTGGARYLRQQLNRFNGDVEKALAAYNAGPGRVMTAGGIPSIPETQAYVRNIVARLASTVGNQGKGQ